MRKTTWMLLAGLLLVAAPLAAKETAVRLWPSKRGATTEGQVELGAPPGTVYAAITDYASWKTLFSDVKSVSVKRGGREDAVVRFKSRALGHTVTIEFDNEKDRLVRFRLTDGPYGARASGEFVLEPIDEGRKTRVTGALYMDVKGATGWFVTDKSIRKKREKKLRTDLTDLLKAFP